MATNETRSTEESPMGWHYVVHGPNTIDGTASVYRCKIGQVWERCEVYDVGEMTPDELRFLADLIERAKTKIVLHEIKQRACPLPSAAGDEMMDWHTIETAPKDGGFILAYDANSMFKDMVEETMWIVQFTGERWRIALDGQSAEPTHWMHLPAPPSARPFIEPLAWMEEPAPPVLAISPNQKE